MRYVIGFILACSLVYSNLAYADELSSTVPNIPQTVQKSPHTITAHQNNATGRKMFVFNPRTRQWRAYDANGKLLNSGRASGGRNYCPDIHRRCHTPVGTFHIYAKEGANCKSSKFPVGRGGAPMPYCSYFKPNFAVHGSYEVRSYNASHGCIRVTPAAAKWIQHNLPIGSTVKVLPY